MYGLTRYIFRQLTGPTVLITLALTVMVWLVQSLRFIDLIADAGISAPTFLVVSFLMIPGVFAVILPIALFCALLHGLSRMIEDRELPAMFAAGLSKWAVARPVLVLGALVTLIAYGLNFYFTPAAVRALRSEALDVRTDYEALLVHPGEYRELVTGLTIFAASRGPDGGFVDVLVHDNRDRRAETTITAHRASLSGGPGGLRLELRDGVRQEWNAETRHIKALPFDIDTLDLAAYITASKPSWNRPKERFLYELFRGTTVGAAEPDENQGAGWTHRRLSAPLYALSFTAIVILALLFGRVSRRGRGLRVAVAVSAALVLRIAGLWLENLVTTAPALVPALYVLIVLPLLAGGLRWCWLLWSRRGSGRAEGAA